MVRGGREKQASRSICACDDGREAEASIESGWDLESKGLKVTIQCVRSVALRRSREPREIG